MASSKRVVRLFDLPHHDAVKLLESGAPVYLSFNPYEYHGPHLPLACDGLIAGGILGDIATVMQERFPEWPVLVADEIGCGADATSGPGSRMQKYGDLKRLVRSSCEALVDLGARRAILNTFHGSALHNVALQEGVEVFQRAGGQAIAPFNLVLHEMIDCDTERFAPAFAHIPDEECRREMREGLGLDFHGGFLETSLLLHYAPDHVSPRLPEVPPCPRPTKRDKGLRALAAIARTFGAHRTAKEMDFCSRAMGWVRIRPFPAYTSRPQYATPDAGGFFVKEILARYDDALVRVFRDGEPPPLPVMRWMKLLTLGGRLSATRVPLSQVIRDLPKRFASSRPRARGRADEDARSAGPPA